MTETAMKNTYCRLRCEWNIHNSVFAKKKKILSECENCCCCFFCIYFNYSYS